MKYEYSVSLLGSRNQANSRISIHVIRGISKPVLCRVYVCTVRSFANIDNRSRRGAESEGEDII
jgi:hypothetical protein